MKKTLYLISIIIALVSLSCDSSSSSNQTTLTEYAVQEIALLGSIADRNSELSGLCWYNDKLILLPQYPDRFPVTDAQGSVFYLEKDSLNAYLNNEKAALTPVYIPIYYDEQIAQLPGFEGFEAVCCRENTIYLTIETQSGAMMGYLVKGEISTDLSRIDLDSSKITPIPPQGNIDNASDESIIILNNQIYTFYEGNGRNVNPSPSAHAFDLELNALPEVSFPHVEYRITDASECATDNTFWVINYFFTGDEEAYNPAQDEIAADYGEGTTHSQTKAVERLLRMKLEGEAITLVDESPVQFSLVGEERNWEGLVMFDENSFLLCTDKYPRTILGYVKISE